MIHQIDLDLYGVLENFGVKATRVLYSGTNWITIYVKAPSDVPPASKAIRKKWKALLKEALSRLDGMDGVTIAHVYNWSASSFLVRSQDDLVLADLLRDARPRVIEAVKKAATEPCVPEHIFAHPASDVPGGIGPGYYILFRDIKCLKASKGRIQHLIRDAVISVLKDSEGYLPDRLDLTFSEGHDPKMKNCFR